MHAGNSADTIVSLHSALVKKIFFQCYQFSSPGIHPVIKVGFLSKNHLAHQEANGTMMCILERITVQGRNEAPKTCGEDRREYAFTENGKRFENARDVAKSDDGQHFLPH